jgi:hypothetical protein
MEHIKLSFIRTFIQSIKIEVVLGFGCQCRLVGVSYVSCRVWEVIAERITFVYLDNNNTNIILGRNERCRFKKIIKTALDKSVTSVLSEL